MIVRWVLQDADSDDEWQTMVDRSDPEVDPEAALALLQDKVFVSRFKSRMQASTTQVLDGILEGASRLRSVIRLLINLVSVKA